jgi:hypothetical protein
MYIFPVSVGPKQMPSGDAEDEAEIPNKSPPFCRLKIALSLMISALLDYRFCSCPSFDTVIKGLT